MLALRTVTADSAIPAAVAPLTSAVPPVSTTTGVKSCAEAISFWAQRTQYAAAQRARQEENPGGDVPRRNFWGSPSTSTGPCRRPPPPSSIATTSSRCSTSSPGTTRRGEEQSVRWIRAFHGATARVASGLAAQNCIDPDLGSWRAAYDGRNYRRPLDIKRRYDPDEVFRFAQGIGSGGR